MYILILFHQGTEQLISVLKQTSQEAAIQSEFSTTDLPHVINEVLREIAVC